ncbi:MAG: hypothetical protein ACR2IV_00450 [Bryobacteraceae bacterium]
MFRTIFIYLSAALGLVAGNTSIGIATVVGSMRMDNADVRGNATVLNGASLETYSNPSQIALSNGNRLELAADSAGTVYTDRLLLDRGFAQLHASSKYSVVTNSLQIVSKNGSRVRIGHLTGNTIQVSVVNGEAQVLNRNGILLASVLPKRALEFTPEDTAATSESSITGRVTKSNEHYYLTDRTTNVTFELEGDKLDAAVGNCINASGPADTTTVAKGANEMIHVTRYQASTCFAQTASTGASVGRIPRGNKPAIIAGATGAFLILTVTPLAMAGAFSGGSANPVSPQ